ncbi:MAG: O-sialoglycoprotein endopeptidase [Firmicutes bacterium]|nr:O-sialoglycoprotein endopeptidase [Bacillota bacterium]
MHRPNASNAAKTVTLSIDTSNYTTSVAAVDASGNIVADERQLLKVEEGERGLRQSQALFQHIVALPDLIKKVTDYIHAEGYKICTVAASDKPRPVDGSYMPVFLAGTNTGRAMAAALNVPFYTFSHQEGHIAAVCGIRPDDEEYLSFHLSGGTGEIISVKGNMPLDIVGGIKDISFGQLLDRTGVALGMEFPAGAQLDRIALQGKDKINCRRSRTGKFVMDNPMMKPIHIDDCFANLSGIETQAQKLAADSETDVESFVAELFCRVSEALAELTVNTCKSTGIRKIVFAGGVSASSFLRTVLPQRLFGSGIDISFGSARLSSDNACGTGRLGMDMFLKEKGQV